MDTLDQICSTEKGIKGDNSWPSWKKLFGTVCLLNNLSAKDTCNFFSPRAENCHHLCPGRKPSVRCHLPVSDGNGQNITISLVGTPFFDVFGKPACQTSQKRSTSVGFPCGRPTSQKRFYLFAIWKIISMFFRRYRESNSHDPHRLWHNY